MSKHSPTPWRRFDNIDDYEIRSGPTGPDHNHVATLHTTCGAEVDHIVKCVNAHDDLVAALKDAYDALEAMLRFPNQEPTAEHVISTARAALKKAGAL